MRDIIIDSCLRVSQIYVQAETQPPPITTALILQTRIRDIWTSFLDSERKWRRIVHLFTVDVYAPAAEQMPISCIHAVLCNIPTVIVFSIWFVIQHAHKTEAVKVLKMLMQDKEEIFLTVFKNKLNYFFTVIYCL